MSRVPALLILSGCLAVGACATTARTGATPDPVGMALQQPMRDLSLIRDQTPPVLLAASAAPYGLEATADCAALTRQIADLDAVLGPDVDAMAGAHKPGAGLAGDLIGGALGLPYRGLVRTVTGAAQRDRDLKAAILAGMVRRGFLKGRQGLACPTPFAPPSRWSQERLARPGLIRRKAAPSLCPQSRADGLNTRRFP